MSRRQTLQPAVGQAMAGQVTCHHHDVLQPELLHILLGEAEGPEVCSCALPGST